MGLDPDNKSYLEQRGGSAAGFVNWLIRKYREREDELRKTMGEPPGTPQGNEAIVGAITDRDLDSNAELELKARTYLAENPQSEAALSSQGRDVLFKVRD
jgi:hypothetical protein